MAGEWHLSGTYFEACNCEVACPCVFLSAPSDGNCTALVGWHIDDGRDGEVALDGLNVALAVMSPGHMLKTQWKVALYLDDRATEAQQGALTRIFGGQAGGHPARLASHIDEVLGVKAVPIEFSAGEKACRITIPEIAETEIESISGQGDGPVTIAGHPLCIDVWVPPRGNGHPTRLPRQLPRQHSDRHGVGPGCA